MPNRKPSIRELIDKYPEAIKHFKRKGAVRIMITERCVVLFNEKGSALESVKLSELERLEHSLKREPSNLSKIIKHPAGKYSAN